MDQHIFLLSTKLLIFDSNILLSSYAGTTYLLSVMPITKLLELVHINWSSFSWTNERVKREEEDAVFAIFINPSTVTVSQMLLPHLVASLHFFVPIRKDSNEIKLNNRHYTPNSNPMKA